MGDIGRVGSYSLVVFSIISLVGSITLPWVVRSPEDEKAGFRGRASARVAPLLSTFDRLKPDLLTAWTLGHLIFSASMILAPFVQSLRFATILVSVCGV